MGLLSDIARGNVVIENAEKEVEVKVVKEKKVKKTPKAKK